MLGGFGERAGTVETPELEVDTHCGRFHTVKFT